MTSQDAVIDPVSITRALRGVYSTRLLCAAVCHLKVFEHAVNGSHTLESLQAELGLAERPTNVL
ncbi:MAG: methyltransferase, partial [Verrucomicrobiia bacterium]